MSHRQSLSLSIVQNPPRATTCAEPDEPHSDEFGRGSAAWDERFSRRNFLTLAGASLALAGVTGCSDRPNEQIVPYVDPPEQVVAGEPTFFATTLTRGGYGRGVIVTSREGRPVKVEGNPDHPGSLGAADAVMQAAVLSLYDPLRSSNVTNAGTATTWGAFSQALQDRLASLAANGGDGLRLLSGSVTSPTLATLFGEVLRTFPNARWHAYEPLGRYQTTAGVVLATGSPGDLLYDFGQADVVVSFASDFMFDEPGSLAYARQFIDRRRGGMGSANLNRLYVAEPDWTITGTKADHRLPAAPARVGRLLQALATQTEAHPAAFPADLTRREADWVSAVATDLAANRGRSLVVVGENQPPAVHALAHAVNSAFGNVGRTVRVVPTGAASPDAGEGVASIRGLVEDVRAGRVSTLLVLADNPVRTAPADFGFADALADLSRRDGTLTAHLGLYANETAFACRWHVPAQHELEQWADARGHDGAVSLTQPLIAPLTQGHAASDVLNLLLGRPQTSSYDTLRTHWRTTQRLDAAGFEGWWTAALRRGVLTDAPSTTQPTASTQPAALAATPTTGPSPRPGLQVMLRPDASILDGSEYHNPWLQELPRPMSKIVWGNAALVSPATASRYAVEGGTPIQLQAGGRTVDATALVIEGIADDTVVLHLGYGRHQIVGGDATAIEANVAYGTDAYPLRTAASPGFATNVTLSLGGGAKPVVRTHNHHALTADGRAEDGVKKALTPFVVASPDTAEEALRLHNRRLIRTATAEQFAKSPGFAAAMDEGPIEQLYPSWNYDHGPQWGMTIDLTACIGCNACITACQAENNTPSVGPEQVDKQREMHWLRVDSYVDEKQHVHHQPVPCMHCENAPCEYVCPVAATTHSVDGLNQMTYNRCVGTRYCSNNCPYKVRRFNFLNYTFYTPEPYKMQRNPDVTVRTRGVMEKCTYCVQRLVYADRKTEIAAVNAGGDTTQLRHDLIGRVQTACQQTCPTAAITFGDLTNPDSAVAKSKRDPRNYGILVELSTKPRTTYLASITNPSPAIPNEEGSV